MQIKNITNNFSSIHQNYFDEEISEIIVSNSFGGVTLDFSRFTFSSGDLTLKLNNAAGSITIIVNQTTRVDNRVLSFVGTQNYSRIEQKEYQHAIILEGKNDFGKINIIEVNV